MFFENTQDGLLLKSIGVVMCISLILTYLDSKTRRKPYTMRTYLKILSLSGVSVLVTYAIISKFVTSPASIEATSPPFENLLETPFDA